MTEALEYFVFDLEQAKGPLEWGPLGEGKLYTSGHVDLFGEDIQYIPDAVKNQICGACRFAEEHPEELKHETDGYAYTSCGFFRVKKRP